MIKLIIIILVSVSAGFAGGFFFFRLRFKKELGLFEARSTAFTNREAEFERVRNALPASLPEQDYNPDDSRLEATVQMLREELEQKELDMGILKDEHDLEVRLLQNELEKLKNGDRATHRYEIEIEDASIAPEETVEAESSFPVSDSAEIEPSDSETAEVKSLDSDTAESSSIASETIDSASDDSGRPPSDPAEWATEVISDLFSKLMSSLSVTEPDSGVESDQDEKSQDEPESGMAEEAEAVSHDAGDSDDALVPEEESPVQTVSTGESHTADASPPRRTYRRLSYPVYRSIVDYLVAPERRPVVGRGDTANGESPMETAGLQMLLGLSDADFAQLTKMGFSSYEDIAQMTSPQIHDLSQKFGIPESRIVNIWISGAHLRLYEAS